MNDRTPESILTIAGSDPSGGAGIQADLKVFSRMGFHGLSVITALTAQNTVGVRAIFPVGRSQLEAQLDALIEDMRPVVTKTGMLPTVEAIDVAADRICGGRLGLLVIDPVLASTGGFSLSGRACAKYLVKKLIPLCVLITPNLAEAEVLTGLTIKTANDAARAAKMLVDWGADAACITGGHWPGAPVDYLFDGQNIKVIDGVRIGSGPFHGTGCVFSAAAAAFLARGMEMEDAVVMAKRFLEQSLTAAVAPGTGMKLPSVSTAER